MRETRKTRAELHRARVISTVRMAVAMAFVLIVLLLAASLEDPPRASSAPKRAAAFAASEAYDEMVQMFGDMGTAEQVAQETYMEMGGVGVWNR